MDEERPLVPQPAKASADYLLLHPPEKEEEIILDSIEDEFISEYTSLRSRARLYNYLYFFLLTLTLLLKALVAYGARYYDDGHVGARQAFIWVIARPLVNSWFPLANILLTWYIERSTKSLLCDRHSSTSTSVSEHVSSSVFPLTIFFHPFALAHYAVLGLAIAFVSTDNLPPAFYDISTTLNSYAHSLLLSVGCIDPKIYPNNFLVWFFANYEAMAIQIYVFLLLDMLYTFSNLKIRLVNCCNCPPELHPTNSITSQLISEYQRTKLPMRFAVYISSPIVCLMWLLHIVLYYGGILYGDDKQAMKAFQECILFPQIVLFCAIAGYCKEQTRVRSYLRAILQNEDLSESYSFPCDLFGPQHPMKAALGTISGLYSLLLIGVVSIIDTVDEFPVIFYDIYATLDSLCRYIMIGLDLDRLSPDSIAICSVVLLPYLWILLLFFLYTLPSRKFYKLLRQRQGIISKHHSAKS